MYNRFLRPLESTFPNSTMEILNFKFFTQFWNHLSPSICRKIISNTPFEAMHTFWVYHPNLLCLTLYWFRGELRTTGCFGKSENMSTSNAAKITWKWGRVIMIIPEVKSMDLQLSNGVSTNTTRQIVAEIHKFEIV